MVNHFYMFSNTGDNPQTQYTNTTQVYRNRFANIMNNIEGKNQRKTEKITFHIMKLKINQGNGKQTKVYTTLTRAYKKFWT